MNTETFDTVNKATIVNNNGVKYLDFRDTLAPRFAMVWLHILSGYFAMALVLVGAGYMQTHYTNYFWLTIPIASILIGYWVAYVHLFMHEASHFNIAADKKTNDFLANTFIGLLVGMDIKFYRTMHAWHHKYLGTTRDTEKSYFEPITIRFVIESLTGIRVLKVLTHRNKNIKNYESPAQSQDVIRRNNLMFISAALLNLLFVILLFGLGYWQVALSWILGMGAVFPFLASFRQILEHRSVDARSTIDYNEVDHGVVHRMFGEGIIAATMGPAGFNRHLLHHWDPQVSYTRFKEVEEYLKDTQMGEELQRSHTTYLRTSVELYNK